MFQSLEDLSVAACELVVAHLARRSGPFVLALSGGNTPRRTYELLGRAGIDWKGVTIVLVDERWVPETDQASNAGMIRQALIEPASIPTDAFAVCNVAESPEQAALEYEQRLKSTVGNGEIDLALLGLGTDGHTASLFPGGPELEERARWIVPSRSPSGVPQRLTMTLACLSHVAQAYFLIDGEEKRAKVAEVFGDGRQLPARLAAERVQAVDWLIARSAWPG